MLQLCASSNEEGSFIWAKILLDLYRKPLFFEGVCFYTIFLQIGTSHHWKSHELVQKTDDSFFVIERK